MAWVKHGPAGEGRANIIASHSLNPEPALVEAVVSGRHEQLTPRLAALLTYAIKLTREPWATDEGDVDALRAHGLSDRDIVDANQVVAYYNYVNRVADGLGVEVET